MAHRRPGPGGRPYFGGGGGGGPVNPWEGGSIPGGGMNSFNSGNSGNLLSHLSEPQAQLALALTKLLQPQQQQQVPSLLTMDTVNPMAPNNSFRNNNYPQRGRFDFDRRTGRPDFRRNDSFNKMHSRGRDTDFNRRRDTSTKSGDKPQARTAGVSKTSKTSSVKTSPKTSGKVDGANEDQPSKDTKDTSVDKELNDEPSADGESGDKKRDWKEEKGDGKMEVDEKGDGEGDESKENADESDEKKENATKTRDPEKKVKDGRYAGIPMKLLHCHVCQKRMWDGESFEKHMNGRAHQQMFDKVEESYRIKADMMRQTIRLMEEKNTIEMDRMKRLGKKMKVQQRSHCAMCNLDFYGYLFAHRKSHSHQKLKQFLHPKCNYCVKEFPTRMEWENHRHTAEHLRKKSENLDKKKDKPKHDEILLDEEDIDLSLDDLEEETGDFVTDLTDLDEITDLKSRIPTYNSKRQVGWSMISEVSGLYCKPCARFFLSEEKAKQHTRTEQHFKSFTDILNEKVTELEDKKRKAQEVEDDEGNWKRRKVANSEAENDNENETTAEEQTVETKEETVKKEGDELYDPADSFNATDPNDVVLNTQETENEGETENTKTWTGNVDEEMKELEEILETVEESKTEEETTPDKPSTPSRGKQTAVRGARRRGRKSN